MRVFITGVSGFVGGRLLQWLSGHDVECAGLSRREPATPLPDGRWTRGDCADLETVSRAVESFRPDVIVHCAMTSGHPSTALARLESLRTSVIGTAAVVEAALAYGNAKLIHAGSFLVYGPSDQPLRESESMRPGTTRGVAKASAELLLQQTAAAHTLDIVILRIFSVYGPGEASLRFIPTLLRSLRDDVPMALTPWPRHDFIHVDDVCAAMWKAATTTTTSGAVFNVASGAMHSNGEVVAIAEQIIGRPLRVAGPHPASPADASSWVADLNTSREGLGWSPAMSLETGLTQTYRALCLA